MKDQSELLPACPCTDGLQCDGACVVPKWVAQRILKARDAHISGDMDEVYHWLYSIASPNFDKVHPWADLEAIADYNIQTIKP